MENPQRQSRGGRGRNPRREQDDAPKNVGNNGAPQQQSAEQQQDRRENRRGNNNNTKPNDDRPADNNAATTRNESRGGRGRGGRGGRDQHEKVDETAANTNKSSSFAVHSSTAASEALTVNAPASGTTFEKLGLISELLKAVSALGYKAPSPIQQQAIPKVLEGKDVLAGAQTGTGKTAAFSLPILQQLFQKYCPNGKAPQTDNRRGNPLRVLVLTPTRELAAQVHDNIRDLSKFLPHSFFSSTVIVGGVSQGAQIAQLKQKPTFLVATPGRLLDFHGQGGIVDLSQVEYLVLDEADRMLDMGFYPDVSKILALLPKEKQSLLFSATFTPDIRNLAGKILRNPIAEVQVTPPNSTVERIQQSFYLVSRDAKDDALVHIIESNKWNQVLVFTRTKGGCNQVSAMLAKRNITSLALHGGKSQTARTTALADFKSGKLRVLVATDIAARGLDIEDLPHVVNYEIPNVPEDYVHRIGRTGRAGKEGFAVSLVCLDEEGFLNNILKFAGKADIPRKTDLPTAFSPAKGEVAQPIAMGRMTLWGGAGPMPPKSVMDAAGKEKRREIANNIRERKEKERDARAAKDAKKGGNPNFNNNNNNNGSARNQAPKRERSNDNENNQRGSGRGGRGAGSSRGAGGRGGGNFNNNNNNNNNNNGGSRGRGAPRGGRQ